MVGGDVGRRGVAGVEVVALVGRRAVAVVGSTTVEPLPWPSSSEHAATATASTTNSVRALIR